MPRGRRGPAHQPLREHHVGAHDEVEAPPRLLIRPPLPARGPVRRGRGGGGGVPAAGGLDIGGLQPVQLRGARVRGARGGGGGRGAGQSQGRGHGEAQGDLGRRDAAQLVHVVGHDV